MNATRYVYTENIREYLPPIYLTTVLALMHKGDESNERSWITIA